MVLKTPVENAPRTSIEKHLSCSPDIPPAVCFPPHRSRPAEYQTNLQPATVCVESWEGEERRRVGRRRGLLPSSARQSLCPLVMQSSVQAPGAQSTWDSMLGVTEDSISQCPFLQMTYTAENPHPDGSAVPGTRLRYRPSAASTFTTRPAHMTTG